MPVIVQQAALAYGARMSLRPLYVMLLALAMLLAPLALQSGAAMAMAPAGHHSQMMNGGHCGEQPAKSHDGKAMDKSCCAAMCAAAAAIVPAIHNGPHALASTVKRPGLDLFRHSFLAELPTPPPRLA